MQKQKYLHQSLQSCLKMLNDSSNAITSPTVCSLCNMRVAWLLKQLQFSHTSWFFCNDYSINEEIHKYYICIYVLLSIALYS